MTELTTCEHCRFFANAGNKDPTHALQGVCCANPPAVGFVTVKTSNGMPGNQHTMFDKPRSESARPIVYPGDPSCRHGVLKSPTAAAAEKSDEELDEWNRDLLSSIGHKPEEKR